MSEFFVGYLSRMPRRYAGAARLGAVLLVAGMAVVGGAMALAQQKNDPGLYEFGVLRDWEGTLVAGPIPMLRTVQDGEPHSYLLAGVTKVGAPAEFLAHAGERAVFKGTLVERGNQAMLEVGPRESWKFTAEDNPAPVYEALGEMTLSGEVIDTKCFFGAMRPAVGKIHRGCAVRCLSGGIPPALRVVDGAGNESIVLLAGTVDPKLAGTFVTARGAVERDGNAVVMRSPVLTSENP